MVRITVLRYKRIQSMIEEKEKNFTLIYGTINEQSNEVEISFIVRTNTTGQSAYERLEKGQSKQR